VTIVLDEKKDHAEKNTFIDISIPITAGMINWPGDPPVDVSRMRDQAQGDDATVSRLSMGAHTGTHMDAPMHFLADGAGMESMPLEAVLGVCRVIEVADEQSIRRESLEVHSIREGERVLLKTRNSTTRWWETSFNENFVYISAAAARYLASLRIMTIGIDYLSVGGFHHDGVATHRALLEAGIWVIEGLDLTRVKPGYYTLCCLPLKIDRGDGAPARAVLSDRLPEDQG
jgi:arylformamidase